VPAPAVIPAPVAYIKVVAVKKPVVEFWAGGAGAALAVVTGHLRPNTFWRRPVHFAVRGEREPGLLL